MSIIAFEGEKNLDIYSLMYNKGWRLNLNNTQDKKVSFTLCITQANIEEVNNRFLKELHDCYKQACSDKFVS